MHALAGGQTRLGPVPEGWGRGVVGLGADVLAKWGGGDRRPGRTRYPRRQNRQCAVLRGLPFVKYELFALPNMQSKMADALRIER